MPHPSGDEIRSLAEHRVGQFNTERIRWDILVKIWNNQWKELFPREFRRGEVIKNVNLVKRSWRLFRNLVGKVPDVRVAKLDLGSEARDHADFVEKACFNYNRVWRMRRKIRNAAFYYVGLGAVGLGVMPDPNARYPKFLVEDPRNCFPGASWDSTNPVDVAFDGDTPGDVGGTLEDMIVQKRLTGHQLLRLFPGNSELLTRLSARTSEESNKLRMQSYTINTFFDDTWIVTVLEDGMTLAVTDHGLKHCPWHFPTVFSPDLAGGDPLFWDSIGLNLAFMRVMDQKLALNDAVVWPWIHLSGQHEIDPVRRIIQGTNPDSKAQILSPPATFQVDRDLNLMRDLIRLLSFETEASQGEVSGSLQGAGRGIVELSKPTTETVQSFFDDFADVLPLIYTDALLLDKKEYGGGKKELSGWGRGEEFFDSYDPREIERFGALSIEFGPGFGGYEGHLQLLQDLGADAIDVETVMEWNQHIRSVSATQRRIFVQKARALMLESGLKGELAVDLQWLAQWIKEVEQGADPQDWLVNNPPPQSTAMPGMAPPVPPGMLPPEMMGGGEEPMIQGPPLGELLGIGA